jgi:c(7)-type cytochrome triheme protein
MQMKFNKTIIFVVLSAYVGLFFVVADLDGVQEARADQNPTEQAARQERTKKPVPTQKTPATGYPDYAIGLFSHKAHASEAGLQCTDCHSKIFQMAAGAAKASGDFNKISFGEGRYCGACHNGTKVFAIQDEANCKRCHGNDVDPPDTILFEKPAQGVLFNHALHNKELGLACNECHMRLFEMKVGSTSEQPDFNMEAMYNGKYCGFCHDSTLAFDLKTDCSKCHLKMPGYDNSTTSASGEKPAAK